MEGHSEGFSCLVGFFEGWELFFDNTIYKDKIQHYF